MKTISWAAIGAAIIPLFMGVVDLQAGARTASVGVSATVLDRCTPSAVSLVGGTSAVRSTPYAAWIDTAATGRGTGVVVANATDRNAPAQDTVCRVPFQQVVVPAVHQDALVVTINY